jgi:hypothetical protein
VPLSTSACAIDGVSISKEKSPYGGDGGFRVEVEMCGLKEHDVEGITVVAMLGLG